MSLSVSRRGTGVLPDAEPRASSKGVSDLMSGPTFRGSLRSPQCEIGEGEGPQGAGEMCSIFRGVTLKPATVREV